MSEEAVDVLDVLTKARAESAARDLIQNVPTANASVVEDDLRDGADDSILTGRPRVIQREDRSRELEDVGVPGLAWLVPGAVGTEGNAFHRQTRSSRAEINTLRGGLCERDPSLGKESPHDIRGDRLRAASGLEDER